MATFQVTTTAAQDAAIKDKTDRYNKTAGDTLTPVDFARAQIDRLFDHFVADSRDATVVNKGQLYQQATPADQATIDSILAKYAT